MTQTRSLFLSSLPVAAFGVGAIIACISLSIGIPIMLVSAAFWCLSRYSLNQAGFAGSLAILAALTIFLYVYGSIDRSSPVYNTNVTAHVWVIIIVGSASLLLGLWLANGAGGETPKISGVEFSTTNLFFWLGLVAVGTSAVNYLTGDIPLFSVDINASRFNGNFGMFGRYWSIIHPVTQISVLVFLLKLQQRRIDLRWAILGLASATSLILSGGRSLLAISVIAFGVMLLEIKRPKLRIVLSIILAGVFAFGLFGNLRSASQTNDIYASGTNIGTMIHSSDRSLQTGPRVLTLAIYYLRDQQLDGQFLTGDLPYVRDRSTDGSDRLVTAILGRDAARVGGLPPTLFGGLYLDFGWTGVVLGATLIGFALTLSRRIMYQKRSLPSMIWFSYFTAYIAISSYSYFSLRPSWIIVLILCICAGTFGKKRDDHASITDGGGPSAQVPRTADLNRG